MTDVTTSHRYCARAPNPHAQGECGSVDCPNPPAQSLMVREATARHALRQAQGELDRLLMEVIIEVGALRIERDALALEKLANEPILAALVDLCAIPCTCHPCWARYNRHAPEGCTWEECTALRRLLAERAAVLGGG